ncbi:bystin [Raphidocelis subcapitata]|uniref:Bystin n=1 Tax=Raphidocelis subcapitata TaxID=307507 RepID=A0A2V0NKT1_9CHLO|nr:bystin [Raphidocelis subcapitata]|eukprot:GBF87629.1 bystin [Raphidocelis subcapitata]
MPLMRKKQRRQRPNKHKQDLGEQLEDPASYGVRTRPRGDKKRGRGDDDGDGDGDGGPLSQKDSSRILREARLQQEELDAEAAAADGEGPAPLGAGALPMSAGALTAALQQLAAGGDSSEGGDDGEAGYSDTDSQWGAGGVTGDDEGVTAEEEAALAAFMPPAEGQGHAAGGQKSLSELIAARIRENQAARGVDVLPGPGDAPVPEGLDERVVEVYRGVGQLLSRYTTGKVRAALRVLCVLRVLRVLRVLCVLRVLRVLYAATKMFVSNLNARLAQRFLALVLLPAVRRDVADNRRLHFALFQALRKATYKPGAFYKGLLLPLCASRSCTLREAVIFTSVLRRSSLPVLHSAAALLRLAQLEYCGTTSFFIRVLLDKKYALPYKVVDALVQHFLRFEDDERAMPVVWHQTLLCFVQRYKHEVREADRDALRRLCGAQRHYQVTPEVLRELEHSAPREAAAAARRAGAAAGAAEGAGAPGGGVAAFAAATAAAAAAGGGVGRHVQEDPRNLPPVPMLDDD